MAGRIDVLLSLLAGMAAGALLLAAAALGRLTVGGAFASESARHVDPMTAVLAAGPCRAPVILRSALWTGGPVVGPSLTIDDGSRPSSDPARRPRPPLI